MLDIRDGATRQVILKSQGKVLRGSKLSDCCLSNVDLSGMDFSDADLRQAHLSMAVISGVLAGGDFRGADVRVTDLTDTELGSSRWESALLANARFIVAKSSEVVEVLGQSVRLSFAIRCQEHAQPTTVE